MKLKSWSERLVCLVKRGLLHRCVTGVHCADSTSAEGMRTTNGVRPAAGVIGEPWPDSAGQPETVRTSGPFSVQARVEGEGMSVVRSLVGHGIGRQMHEDPQIPNYGDPGRGPLLEEGMVLAIEPMVNAGRHPVRMGDDGWSIYSQDGSLAAHFEFTVAVTADGPRVLTPWHLDEGA